MMCVYTIYTLDLSSQPLSLQQNSPIAKRLLEGRFAHPNVVGSHQAAVAVLPDPIFPWFHPTSSTVVKYGFDKYHQEYHELQ